MADPSGEGVGAEPSVGTNVGKTVIGAGLGESDIAVTVGTAVSSIGSLIDGLDVGLDETGLSDGLRVGFSVCSIDGAKVITFERSICQV